MTACRTGSARAAGTFPEEQRLGFGMDIEGVPCLALEREADRSSSALGFLRSDIGIDQQMKRRVAPLVSSYIERQQPVAALGFGLLDPGTRHPRFFKHTDRLARQTDRPLDKRSKQGLER